MRSMMLLLTLVSVTMLGCSLDASDYLERGSDNIDQGEYDKAIVNNDIAIEKMESSLAGAYLNRAIAYGAKGEHERSLSDFSKSIELDPNQEKIYYNRGTQYAAKDDYDRALADFDMAIELAPDYTMAYINRGITHHIKGHYNKAFADLNKAIQLNPRDGQLYFTRGVVYEHQGEIHLALDDYKRALELDYDDAKDDHERVSAIVEILEWGK